MIATTWPTCPDHLTTEHLEQYNRDGFLAFSDALSPEEVVALGNGLRQMIVDHAFHDERATYHPGDKSKGNVGGGWFQSKQSKMFIQLEPGYEPKSGDIDGIERHVRKFMHFENESPIFDHVCFKHPRLRPIIETILGPEPTLLQSLALVKPAFIGSEKPWHQDNAYFSTGNPNAVLGIWIALDEATPENGCMHVLPGGHRVGALRHQHTFDCEIVPDRIDPSKAIAVELPPGGALIFHGNIPHQTPANRSPHSRRAIQFHFRAASNTNVSREEYDRIFAEPDGTPASCANAWGR